MLAIKNRRVYAAVAGLSLLGLVSGCGEDTTQSAPPPAANVGVAPAPTAAAKDSASSISGPTSNAAADSTQNPNLIPKGMK